MDKINSETTKEKHMNPTLIKNALREIVLVKGVKTVFNPANGFIFSFHFTMSMLDILKIKEICEWFISIDLQN